MAESMAERALRARLAAHTSWAHTGDRTARTENARKAFLDRFEREVDPDGFLPAAERAERAESARKAFYARLALKSAQSRRRATESRRAAAHYSKMAAEAATEISEPEATAEGKAA